MGETKLLSDVVKEKLTKTENFLVNAKVGLDDWELTEDKFKKGVYMDLSHMMAFSEMGIPIDKKGYEKIIVDLSLLKKMLLYFNRNIIAMQDSISLYLKKDCPIQFFNGEIWGSLAPRTEADDE